MPATLKRPPSPAVRPLADGEAVSRGEYLRRAAATPGVRMERINGTVRTAAAIRRDVHGRPELMISHLLAAYELETPGVEASSPATAMIGEDDDPEADCHLLVLPEYGGQTRFTEDGYVDGCPELMVEVAASSLRTDLVEKRAVYERGGAKEYVVWATERRAFHFFVRDGDRLLDARPDNGGVFRSRAFPGLWIDCDALLDRDLRRAAATLNEGVRAPEHADFVSELRGRGPAGD